MVCLIFNTLLLDPIYYQIIMSLCIFVGIEKQKQKSKLHYHLKYKFLYVEIAELIDRP